MQLEKLYSLISDFSKETHGSSNYDADEFFVKGKEKNEFAPLRYLYKKFDGIKKQDDLLELGFVIDDYELFNIPFFKEWYERQFSKKMSRAIEKKVSVIYLPNNREIFDAIEGVNKNYELLRQNQILINGKNLPVQLGEWYVKCIFGLRQNKSTSQRGFDFSYKNMRVEIKVHWADQSSPKGVKIKKSLIELSDFCIIIYLAKNFTIREICFLDSEFILRRFARKGHTIFLKDNDISSYFFSQSEKHLDKVVNSTALLKYSSPTLAMRIAESFEKTEKGRPDEIDDKELSV